MNFWEAVQFKDLKGGRTIFSSLKSLVYYVKQVFYPNTFLTPIIGGRNSIFNLINQSYQSLILLSLIWEITFFVYICE